MKSRRRRAPGFFRLRNLLLGGAASALLVSAATAGGMAVFDGQNMAQNILQVKNMIEMVAKATEQVKQLTSLNGAVGAAKSSVNVAMPGFNTGVTSTLASIKPDYGSWNLGKDVTPSAASPKAAVTFLTKSLDTPRKDNGDLKGDLTSDQLQQILGLEPNKKVAA